MPTIRPTYARGGTLLPVLLAGMFIALGSCTKNIDLDLPAYESEVVVEGYVNDELPLFNYFVLSRSTAFFDPNLNATNIPNASILVEEGDVLENGRDTVWQRQWQLQELQPDVFLPDSALDSTFALPSFYLDPTQTWVGKPGHVYRATIAIPGQDTIRTQTSIPERDVPLDSITYELEPTNDTLRGLVRYHFQEPPGLGDSYRFMAIKALPLDPTRRSGQGFFGWGNFNLNFVVDDQTIDGEYRSLTTGLEIAVDDSLTVFLNKIDRTSYAYWESFFDARDNGGPFAQPINPKSNVQGALGAFTGMNVSYIDTVVQKP
jgi:hypothetical protein